MSKAAALVSLKTKGFFADIFVVLTRAWDKADRYDG